jgi:hypothetical protein
MPETSVIPDPELRVPASLLRRLMEHTQDCLNGDNDDPVEQGLWADIHACADLIIGAERAAGRTLN